MRRMIALTAVLVVTAAATTVLVASAGGAGQRTLTQAQAAGWDCTPLILIGGHYHCSPPGRPSVADIIAGTDVASVVHQVFDANGNLAGTELLIRADLYAGQPCPTDEWLPVPPWLPVPQYYACHRFDFTP